MNNIVFLCGARDFHAMDWYRSAQEQIPKDKIGILTDLIESEGYVKLINNDDKVSRLLVIDSFLFKKQSTFGNLWRNIVKFLVLPIQILLLRRFFKKNKNSIFHAHCMYYIWMAAAANVPFIGTPQGSDVLVRPFRSRLFYLFSSLSMKKAMFITVDSEKMKEKVEEISGVKARIIQNGIDLREIESFLNNSESNENNRKIIMSQRGMAKLYRIKEIISSRNKSNNKLPINFIYPFYENGYKEEVIELMIKEDKDLGRVTRKVMYELFFQSQLVLSIPSSDSSPRSVYEAIFCGAVVGVTYHPYYDVLPNCMKERIILIDLDDNNWFEKAVSLAREIVYKEFVPSEEALNMFDQRRSFTKILNLIKG